MKPERMTKILKGYFGEDIELVSFREDSSADASSEEGDLSPRDRLLMIYRRRIENLSTESPMHIDVEKFMSELEKLPLNTELYFWECKVGYESHSGWASNDSVIFSLNRNPL